MRTLKDRKFLTSADLAAFCDVDIKTVHNWVNAGKITSWRSPGKHLRFDPAVVETFLRERGYPVPPELAEKARAIQEEAAKAAATGS